MRISIVTLLATCLISTAASAATITIDFQDADRSLIRNSQDPDACIANVSVNHNGFNFNNPGNCSAYYEFFDGTAQNIGLFYASIGSESSVSMTMSRLDGKRFDLLELDLLRGASRWTNIEGYRDGLEVLSQRFTLSGFSEHVTLNWLDLDSVVFFKRSSAPNSFGVDNIKTSVVPIPAAVWLFASALGLLGWSPRKSK